MEDNYAEYINTRSLLQIRDEKAGEKGNQEAGHTTSHLDQSTVIRENSAQMRRITQYQ